MREAKKVTQPTDSDCAEGARLALQNAEAHYAAAAVLAEHQFFGPACALLVLSLEEAQKAHICSLVVAGLPAEDLALKAVLSQHKPRHAQAMWDTFGLANLAMMERHIDDIEAEYAARGEPIDGPSARAQLVQRLEAEVKALTAQTPATHPLLAAFDWIARSDERKQQGFYVDFRHGRWITPAECTADEYEAGHIVTRRFLDLRRDCLAWVERSSEKQREELVASHEQVKQSLKADPSSASIAGVLERTAQDLRPWSAQ